jgi:transcriptional regulator with XRE-family HTH domain
MPRPSDELTSAVPQRAEFAGEFLRWRLTAQLSQGQLGDRMGYDRTYINKVERGALDPTAHFAEKADEAFGLNGDLAALWRAFDTARRMQAMGRGRRPPHADKDQAAADIVVQHDEAWLRRGPDAYDVRMRKTILNVGQVPVLRYLMRVTVDKYPGEPKRSNAYYRGRPLTMEELHLAAHCEGEPMDIQVAQDRDSSKEIWLLFCNPRCQFPLYPGKQAVVEYSFRVCLSKWGDFFQRSIRLPTRRVSVHLEFPAALEPVVWGVETSPAANELLFANPIEQTVSDAVQFDWSAHRPPIGTRYRLQWRLAADDHKESHDDAT